MELIRPAAMVPGLFSLAQGLEETVAAGVPNNRPRNPHADRRVESAGWCAAPGGHE